MSARIAPGGTAPTEIVVLGGGYVGVWAARRIARDLRRRIDAGGVRLTIVSATDHHAFHGWTAEIITGHVRPERARVPLRTLVPRAEFVQGIVSSVDLAARRVEVLTDDGVRLLSFDHVVIGVGSADASSRVPGLPEQGWSVKSPGGLEAFDAHLDDIVARARTADAAERARLLTVVVAGGGLAGAELATAISDRLRRATTAAAAGAGRGAAAAGAGPRVVLAHSGARLVTDLRPAFDGVADHATAEVARAGVEIRRGARLTHVSADAAALDDGTRIPTATVVSALGQRPVVLSGLETLPRDPSGRLVTDRYLRAGKASGVWTGGDVAAVPHPNGRGPCRADALWAIHHGTAAGANIARAVRGRRPRPFRFPGLGRAASFGVGRGAGELYGIPLIGWAAWIPRWALFHYYMPSRRVALVSALEWFRPGRRAAAPVAARTAQRQARPAAPQPAAKRSVAATRAAAIPGSVAE